ncbi:MAG TPA: regulatory iron-sulfur-containing complex subunit RicT [Gaiellaceae bacterium]|jgi:cell fate regulator YaaT (PSP1 superfamily)
MSPNTVVTEAVGVVLSPGGRVYSFDPAGLDLAWNEQVICQTSRGQELGRVVKAHHPLREPPPQPLKRVVRRATERDLEQARENKEDAHTAMRAFRELAKEHGVVVKPIAAEIVFDRSRVVFSYECEERQDTRALMVALRDRLHKRIELRSVGPREGARLCGDHGLCGTKHCCRRFPSHEQPITLRMAKDQDLSMSSGRITGLCGRLRCCLAYEHPMYRSFRERAPRVGRRVQTPQGTGVVTGYEVLRDACTVDLGEARAVEVSIDECRELARE